MILCRVKWNVCAESLRDDDSYGVEALLFDVSMVKNTTTPLARKGVPGMAFWRIFDCLFHHLCNLIDQKVTAMDRSTLLNG